MVKLSEIFSCFLTSYLLLALCHKKRLNPEIVEVEKFFMKGGHPWGGGGKEEN